MCVCYVPFLVVQKHLVQVFGSIIDDGALDLHQQITMGGGQFLQIHRKHVNNKYMKVNMNYKHDQVRR